MRCGYCGSSSRLKSNRAVHQEYLRQAGELFRPSPFRCRTEGCANAAGARAEAFQRFGSTKGGSHRYRCRACKATLSVPKPTVRQRITDVSADIMLHLVNKTPINRIAEVCGVEIQTLYGKIAFIHRQCMLWSAAHEAKLKSMDLGEIVLCTDRQDYLVNWGDREARQSIQLTSVVTADRRSRYVFGFDINYDDAVDPETMELAYTACGDAGRPPHMRDWARVWTRADYAASLARAEARRHPRAAGRLGDAVDDSGTARDDLEVPEAIVVGQQLPSRGAQVHAEYLVHGHFRLLRHMLGGTRRILFCIDHDAGLLSGVLGAFADRVRDGAADVVQVRCEKELSRDERERIHAATQCRFEAALAEVEGADAMDRRAKQTAVMTAEVTRLRLISPLAENRLQQVWVESLLPSQAEPNRAVRFVTDTDHLDDAAVGALMRRATLWPVDTVLNMVRRRVSMVERPILSVRRARRMWQIYAPYDPAVLAMMLGIFRTWHNYVWRTRKGDRLTAAQRLRLVKDPCTIEQILSYDLRPVARGTWKIACARAAAEPPETAQKPETEEGPGPLGDQHLN